MTGRITATVQELQQCLNFLNKARDQRKHLYTNLVISSIITVGTIYLGMTDLSMVQTLFEELNKKYLFLMKKAKSDHQKLLAERSHLQDLVARYKYNLFRGSTVENEINEHYDHLLTKFWHKKNEAYDQWHTTNCLQTTPLHLYPYVCHSTEHSSRIQEQNCRTIFESYCQQYKSIDQLTHEKELRQCQYGLQGNPDRFALELFTTALSNNEQAIKEVISKKDQSWQRIKHNEEWMNYTKIFTSITLVLISLILIFWYFKDTKSTLYFSLKFPFTGETKRWMERVGTIVGIHGTVDQINEDYFIQRLKQVIADLESSAEIENQNIYHAIP